MSRMDLSTEHAEHRLVREDLPGRIEAVANTLGVSPHDLRRALGAHRLMLVKCSNLTAAYLLGIK